MTSPAESRPERPSHPSPRHLRHLRRLPRPRRQDPRGEPLPLIGFRVHPLVVDPRRRHRHRTGNRRVTRVPLRGSTAGRPPALAHRWSHMTAAPRVMPRHDRIDRCLSPRANRALQRPGRMIRASIPLTELLPGATLTHWWGWAPAGRAPSTRSPGRVFRGTNGRWRRVKDQVGSSRHQ